MNMTTSDKMFAIEDNRDYDEMRELYGKTGVIGTYQGIDIADMAIDEITRMVAVDSVGEEIIELNRKSLEELGYNFEVGV